ncbi:hypothetical protein, partial [Paraburkholderia terrae]|uniref:hypothetical protein n=1 Tax=Paraburkholderia terrae TaxID=311230 RepID=UPI001C3F150E
MARFVHGVGRARATRRACSLSIIKHRRSTSTAHSGRTFYQGPSFFFYPFWFDERRRLSVIDPVTRTEKRVRKE